MERSLNLLWLALVLVTLAYWWLKGSRLRPQVALASGVLAVLCAALLLFPVISITDDLQNLPLFSEGPASGQDLVQKMSQANDTVALPPTHMVAMTISPEPHGYELDAPRPTLPGLLVVIDFQRRPPPFLIS